MNGFGGPHVQNFKQQCFFGVSISKSGAWCIMDSNHARRDDFLNPGTFVAVAVGLLLDCTVGLISKMLGGNILPQFWP